MKWHLIAAVLLLGCDLAGAAQDIGQTVTVKNQVTGELNTVVRRLSVGDSVASDERVITGTASATLLRFLDNTQLNVGAASTVVLDRFVFNPSGSAKDAAINISTGAMRFVTGNSNARNFTVSTPVATIGIRGTDFMVLCSSAKGCAVVVDKGIVGVCPMRPGQPAPPPTSRCNGYFELNTVNNFAIIDPNGNVAGPQALPRSAVEAAQREIAAGAVVTIAGFTLPNVTRFAGVPAGGVVLPVVGGLAGIGLFSAIVRNGDHSSPPITGND